jgi:hypothetical protein
MKYMLLAYSQENSWTKEEWTKCTEVSSGICHELAAKGQFLGASPLHPVATAKSLRLREGQPLVTAGPFAETVEQLGGYFLVDVADLDEAIAIAGRLPSAKKGTVEIRPVFELPGVPAEKTAAPAGKSRFMLLSYDDEEYWANAGPAATEEGMKEATKLCHELDARGQYLVATPLHRSPTATSVRVRDSKRIVTDGPFAETREVLGGFYMLALNHIDEALDAAIRHAAINRGTVEIRQVFDLSTLPYLPQPAGTSQPALANA